MPLCRLTIIECDIRFNLKVMKMELSLTLSNISFTIDLRGINVTMLVLFNIERELYVILFDDINNFMLDKSLDYSLSMLLS